jgi:drug/metabolite transporter (DMT)-like permease
VRLGFTGYGSGHKLRVVAPIGLGALLILVGLVMFFVPGIGILGVILIIVGVLLVGGAFASTRRRRAPAPPP